MPNNKWFTKGDNTAVKMPTFIPNLYAAISVKKYMGRNINPPLGIE
jgi:hypothetical protein